MNCVKCDTPMKSMGEMKIQGRLEILPMVTFHNHIVEMWVCSKCSYVELYYKKKTLSV